MTEYQTGTRVTLEPSPFSTLLNDAFSSGAGGLSAVVARASAVVVISARVGESPVALSAVVSSFSVIRVRFASLGGRGERAECTSNGRKSR